MITSESINNGTTGYSKALLKIRQAALGKAANEIREQRQSLHDDFRNGRVDEADYQKSLFKLLLKGKVIQQDLKEIEQCLCA